MTREEIEAMMQEVGLKLDAYDSQSAAFWYPQIERFAHLVAKHTQEQCAKICDDEVNIRVIAGRKHPENSESRDRCFAAARAANNCAIEIRALTV